MQKANSSVPRDLHRVKTISIASFTKLFSKRFPRLTNVCAEILVSRQICIFRLRIFKSILIETKNAFSHRLFLRDASLDVGPTRRLNVFKSRVRCGALVRCHVIGRHFTDAGRFSPESIQGGGNNINIVGM